MDKTQSFGVGQNVSGLFSIYSDGYINLGWDMRIRAIGSYSGRFRESLSYYYKTLIAHPVREQKNM